MALPMQIPSRLRQRYSLDLKNLWMGRVFVVNCCNYNLQHMMYGFVELDVLTGDTGADLSNREWKETTRWIKVFEQDFKLSCVFRRIG